MKNGVDRMRLSHNIASLNIYKGYKVALTQQAKAMKNISYGCKVNSAADDPYGVAQDEIFNMQLRGLQVSRQNAQDDINLLQTAEGGMSGITAMIEKAKELTIQAGNGANNSQDQSAIQLEINQLVQGIDKLAKSTNMNGVAPLSKEGSITAMIGANVGENTNIPTYDFQTAKLGLTDTDGNVKIDISTEQGRTDASSLLDSALQKVIAARSKNGAIENRLNSVISNSNDTSAEVENADSNVMDADMASEMLAYSKNSIIVQAGIAMMVQTNKLPQDVLNILSNVRSK